MRAHRRILGALTALSLSALGCGGEDHHEENPNAEACEHLQEADAPVAITAAATSSPTAPAVRADHARYDVTTVAVAGGKGGYLTFASAAAGDYIFFASAPVQLTVKNPAGADIAAESSATSIPECSEVKGRYVYPLQVGTHILGISTSADEVSFVVEGHAH
jgi:hypothetical protein